MPTSPNFQLRIGGLKPEKLIEIQGERGPFYVCISGDKPEFENGIFYGDELHQFCFFTRLISEPRSPGQLAAYDLEIYRATARRLDGVLPKIPKADAEYIKRNITLLFRTLKFPFLRRPIDPKDAPRDIRFTWRISQ